MKAAPRGTSGMDGRVLGAQKGHSEEWRAAGRITWAAPVGGEAWNRVRTIQALRPGKVWRGRRAGSPPRPGADPARPTPSPEPSSAERCRSPDPRPRRGAQLLPAQPCPRRRSPCRERAPGGAASEPASSAPPGGRCNSRTRRRGPIRGRSRRRCPSPGSPCRNLASRPGSQASWCQCPGRRGPGSP